MPKIYAIKKGRKPGVYLTWADAKAQVDGFPGAVHKSFKDVQEVQYNFSQVSPVFILNHA